MTQADRHIEEVSHTDLQAQQLVLTTIRRLEQKVTKALLVHETGLSVYKVEDAIASILKDYPCRLSVNEKGIILYEFDLSTPHQEKKSLVQKITASIRFVLTLTFKLWIVLMVYTFGVLYGGVLVIGITALAKSGTPILYYFLGLFVSLKELVFSIYFYLFPNKKPTNYHTSKYNLIQIAFDLVFGQKQSTDKLEMEKKILDFLEYHEYKITVAELALLTGWSLEKADHEVLQLMSHYRGEPKVSENGIIVYHFDVIRQEDKTLDAKTAAMPVTNWIYYYHPFEHYTTHSKDIRMSFMVVVGVGFFFSFLFTLFSNPLSYHFWSISLLFTEQFFNSFWSSYFSLTFCCLFFAIPLLRQAKLWRTNYQREVLNFRRSIYEFIYSNLPFVAEKNMAKWQVPIVDKIRFELEGQTQNATNGDIIYQFDLLKKEMDEINATRQKKTHLPEHIGDRIDHLQINNGFVNPDWLQKAKKSASWGYFWLLSCLAWPLLGFFLTSTLFMETAYLNLRQAIFNPEQTTSLDLSYADDASIVKYLPYFKNLEEVNLTYITTLKEFPTELTQLPHLNKLIFYENPRVNDFTALSQLQQLTYLDLGGTRTISEKRHFQQLLELKQLKTLSLSRVGIDSTQIALLQQLPQLDSLDLSYNKFRQFPTAVTLLTNLRYLSLENSDLDTLLPSLANLKNLENLNVNYNRFRDFQPVIFELKNLHTIQLYHRRRDLPRDWSALPNIKKVYIRRIDGPLNPKDVVDDIILPQGAQIYYGSEEENAEEVN